MVLGGSTTWQARSDPYARQASQGHRPQPCGLGALLGGLLGSAKGGNLLPELMMIGLHSPQVLQQIMPLEAWQELPGLIIGFTPLDWVYD